MLANESPLLFISAELDFLIQGLAQCLPHVIITTVVIHLITAELNPVADVPWA